MKNISLELPDMLQRYFAFHLGRQRGVSPRTVESYRDTIRLLLMFLAEQLGRSPERLLLADLGAEHLLAFLDHLEQVRKNSARTRNQRRSAICSFLRYVGRQLPETMSYVQRALAIPYKRYAQQSVDYLTRNEIAALLQAPDASTWSGQRDRVLFTVLYNTGARVSEVAIATVHDVVWQRPASIHLHGKGRKDRITPLWRKTALMLRDWIRHEHLSADSPLFSNSRGETMTRSGIAKRLEQAVTLASGNCPSLKDKSISPHVLRHTTAMHLLQSGVDISVIALWLGHENITTTHRYMTADLNMKEKALAMLQEPSTRGTRYRPSDKVLSFLESL